MGSLENLLSGAIGAGAGALATLWAARWQLRKMSDAHAEALAHQNVILEKTFAHQIALLGAEKKLGMEIELLTSLTKIFDHEFRNVQRGGFVTHGNWADKVEAKGPHSYISDLMAYRNSASAAFVNFGLLLNEHTHLPHITTVFEAMLSIQAKLFDPTNLLIEAVGKLPPTPSQGSISLIALQADAFNRSVQELEWWINDARTKALKWKTALLDGTYKDPTRMAQ